MACSDRQLWNNKRRILPFCLKSYSNNSSLIDEIIDNNWAFKFLMIDEKVYGMAQRLSVCPV